jgi:hypothetical protein
MSDCLFCGSFVGEVNGDGGAKGRTIGNRDVCEQCLAELKYWLNGTLARSPSMREKKLEEEEEFSDDSEEIEPNQTEDSNESTEETRESSSDPFSAGTKI